MTALATALTRAASRLPNDCTRLENDTQREIVSISLPELVWQAVDESEEIEGVMSLERQDSFEKAQNQMGVLQMI